MTPLKLPRPWLPCARCNARRPFVCSGKFRVNAQKKRLDAWLVYRCAHCEQSWNFPVLERCPVNAIEPALLRALTENDATLARRHAFDLVRLARYCAEVESFADLAVERQRITGDTDNPAVAEIAIRLPYACGLRLDRFLAGELGLSRSRLMQLAETGGLVLLPATRRALSQEVRDGQTIVVDLWRAFAAEAPSMAARIAGEDSCDKVNPACIIDRSD
ncbi:DUF1062 domain-containing protein [Hypericibacter adhaerens]|uniref:DUF1062 domain-containing protein n=1 Tax=Hypericibacter adhaerens TaxID=2602016 RepID=UPI0017830C5D|nr:DUF1062 domain-containing protein [Hypericibacter adhaerens]